MGGGGGSGGSVDPPKIILGFMDPPNQVGRSYIICLV